MPVLTEHDVSQTQPLLEKVGKGISCHADRQELGRCRTLENVSWSPQGVGCRFTLILKLWTDVIGSPKQFRDFVNTRLHVHKHVKNSVGEWIF